MCWPVNCRKSSIWASQKLPFATGSLGVNRTHSTYTMPSTVNTTTSQWQRSAPWTSLAYPAADSRE
jgi:hypothetical protein